jgi:predicted Zn-dependent protease
MLKRMRIAQYIWLLILFTVISWSRNAIWIDEISLWRDSAAKSPEKAGVYYSLGSAYAKAGRYDDAFTAMKESIKLDGGSQLKEWLSADAIDRAKTRGIVREPEPVKSNPALQ